MKLDKKTIRAAQNLIKRSPSQVTESAVLRAIVQELELGEVRNKKILFTPSDLIEIENYFNKLLGQPILNVDLDVKTRLEASSTFIDEKWASGGVFEAMISMTGGDKIPLNSGELEAQPNVVYSVKPSIIDISKINKLIIIENGELLTNWELVIPLLPHEYQSAIAVFRGYGANQKYLNDLISEVRPNAMVGVFFDYDAAGIDMALRFAKNRVIDLIVPSKLSEDVTKKSKIEEFGNQFGQLTRRLNSVETPKEVKEVLTELRDKKLAITQEHLITHGVQMKIIKNVGETI